ncbi:MAG: aldo/keto reductase, partial [Candidatus Nanopelagicales bacterium]
KYQNPAGWAVLEELMAVAKELETSVSTAALAWLRHHPQVSAPIASARTVAQLIEIMPLVTLSDDQITRLNSVSSSS